MMNDSDPFVIKYKEIALRLLKSLQDNRIFSSQWTIKMITKCLLDCRDEYRCNMEAIDTLIKAGLVNLQQYDLALSMLIESGNYLAMNLGMQLVKVYLVDERVLSDGDLANTIEILAKIHAHSRQPIDGLNIIIDALRQSRENNSVGDIVPVGPTVHIHNGILQVRNMYDDPPGLQEKTEFLLREWVNLYTAQPGLRDSLKTFTLFVHQMNIHGLFKSDDLLGRFFKVATQLCIENVYRYIVDKSYNNSNTVRLKCYTTIDALVRLTTLLIKHSGDGGPSNPAACSTKVLLVNKILGIVVGCLFIDMDNRRTEFHQMPYHRFFSILFTELSVQDPVFEAINTNVLTAFCHIYHILRPSKAAGFCYAWLGMISDREFMGRILATSSQQKTWPFYAQLLIDLFKYLAPFLRNAELAKPVQTLYKGTLKVLLVLLHDFPEFLCDYHYGFCDVIPPNCIQMRNLILSAFPRNMRLPDPFMANLKRDNSEVTYEPRIMTDVAAMIQPPQFKMDLNSYLKARAPVTFLSDLRGNLKLSNEPGAQHYNIPLINALVLYVGSQAIAYIRSNGQTPNMTTVAHSAHMDIFQNLAVDLDTEGRYLFLNAVANQLRYPNSHTHYFSCTLLYLFSAANSVVIQEQITRVLLERLIVNRPHPWGLLITFIELIKNPHFKFWKHEFVHCAGEIEKLFESVARSCMVQKSVVQAQESELPE